MTISATPSEVIYVGDGMSVAFAIPFPFDTPADLTITSTVIATGDITTLTSGFAITGGGSGGTITFMTAPASTVKITVLDDPQQTQPTDYVSLDAFPAESHERALDRVTRLCKRLHQQWKRTLRFPDGDLALDGSLAPTASRKGKYLFFNIITGAMEYATALSGNTLSQSTIASFLSPMTQAELNGGADATQLIYGVGNVLRYGADPTGVSDSSAAFNQAAYFSQSPILAPGAYKTVYVPAGQYKVSNTVYIPPGTILRGDGMSSYIDASSAGAFNSGVDDVFKLGWSVVNGVPTKRTDSLTGGFPPQIYGLFVNGGPGAGNVVNIDYPGALCHDMWFSFPGTAVYLAGGYLYNCEIDGGLTGITIGPGINQTVENVRFFNQSTTINFDTTTGDISDCLIMGCTIEYPKITGISFGSGARNVRGIKFVGCDFINNPISTFSSLVSIALANLQVEFNACTFHNWGTVSQLSPAYAFIIQAAGAVVDLKGCLFDGSRSNVAYTASPNAAVALLNQGTLRITDTQIRNLPATYGQGITLGGSTANVLQIDGLMYSGSGQGNFPITAITVGTHAVVTSSNGSTSQPFQVGAYLNFTGMTGMTELNGAEGYITAVGGSIGAWTATTNLNTTGFGTFTGGTALLSLPLVNITNSSTSTQCFLNNVKGDALQPLLNSQSVFPVRIKNATDWFGPVALWPNTGVAYSLIPYQAANLWQVALGANPNQAGSGSYRKCRLDNVEKDNDNATSNKSFIVQNTAIQGAANTNPALTLTAEFNQPGGGANIASANTGVMAVSWPNTYTFVSVDVQQLLAA